MSNPPPQQSAGRGRGRPRSHGRGRRGVYADARKSAAATAGPPSVPKAAAEVFPGPISLISAAPLPPIAPVVQQPAPGSPLFADLVRDRLIDPPLISAITDGLGYQAMTPVQHATIRPLLSGMDCLAKAKTGTGKTIAFLVPTIQALLQKQYINSDPSVGALIMSPTRELALQIAAEGTLMLKNYPRMRIQTFIGGTNARSELTSFNSPAHGIPRIVVATPGRLKDHLANAPNVKPRFSNLDVWVLDEADRLLDQGFKRDIDAIAALLPTRQAHHRQTLLFSATVPREVQELCKTLLAPGYHTINTVAENEVETHDRIPQHLLTAPLEDHLPTVLSLLRTLAADKSQPVKAVLFYPTARATGLAYEAYQKLASPPLPANTAFEIHSRKSQTQRTRTADAFRTAQSGLLFSSDVSARGMDFPDVTQVIQVGTPQNGEQYVHRIGRTGRAGKGGAGFLVLDARETWFVAKELRTLPIGAYPAEAAVAAGMPAARADIAYALKRVGSGIKGQTYAAWLGYYKGFLRPLKLTSLDLVRVANAYAASPTGLGWVSFDGKPPPLLRKTVGKMGIKEAISLLNIVAQLPGNQSD